MKRLNLDDTWKYCLRMWRWIAEQRKIDNFLSVSTLKRIWLSDNGFSNVESNCFFCERNKRNISCRCCPAALVEERFYCMNDDYHFSHKPIHFYKRLRKLNRLRKLGRKLQ